MQFVDMHEPPMIPEFFVNGIGRIEDVCGSLRLVLYALENDTPNSTTLLRLAKVRIVMPTPAVHRSAMQAASFANEIGLYTAH